MKKYLIIFLMMSLLSILLIGCKRDNYKSASELSSSSKAWEEPLNN